MLYTGAVKITIFPHFHFKTGHKDTFSGMELCLLPIPLMTDICDLFHKIIAPLFFNIF